MIFHKILIYFQLSHILIFNFIDFSGLLIFLRYKIFYIVLPQIYPCHVHIQIYIKQLGFDKWNIQQQL
ncbi:hypothetical protein pb186bvf_008294 [Paramecium bursaria]